MKITIPREISVKLAEEVGDKWTVYRVYLSQENEIIPLGNIIDNDKWVVDPSSWFVRPKP